MDVHEVSKLTAVLIEGMPKSALVEARGICEQHSKSASSSYAQLKEPHELIKSALTKLDKKETQKEENAQTAIRHQESLAVGNASIAQSREANRLARIAIVVAVIALMASLLQLVCGLISASRQPAMSGTSTPPAILKLPPTGIFSQTNISTPPTPIKQEFRQ